MIYLDYSATTPPNEKVLETFNKVSTDYFANSNSLHRIGNKSKQLEDYATEKIARLLKVKETEIIYTSGASESNNHAIKGVCLKYKNRGAHIITTKLEHSSVIKTMNYLETQGFKIDYVKIKPNGQIDIDNLKSLLTNNTILVSICAVDSELGIKQPIEEVAQILKEYPKCYFHVDCTQAIGKIKIDFSKIDLASLSAHKFFGLKGIGILIKKEKINIENLIHGGKSTTNYRSGTPALPLIVSTMKALELIISDVDKNYENVLRLNKKITDSLQKYDAIHLNSTEFSLPYVINFSLENIKPETFLHALDTNDVYISTKSACSDANTISEPVYAVTNNEQYAKTSLRISLSYKTKDEEIERFLEIFDKCYQELSLK